MKRFLLSGFFMLLQTMVFAQQEVTIKSQLIDIPGQNLLKYNRSLFHPTFSYVRNYQQELTLYSRIQWVEIENSPKTYIFSYSGNVGENAGAGLSLFQQNLGIISNFGAIVNGAYGIQLSEDVILSMGANLSFFRSSLINNADVTNDPALANFEESLIMIAQPGINLSVGRFDIGVYGENLVDYNLKSSESLTDFSEKTFSGHLMYTHPIDSRSQLLDDARLQVAATGLIEGSNTSQLGGSLLLDLPEHGWVQAGYNDFYGYAFGAGFKISPEIGLGIVLEKGTNVSSLLGPTYEVTVNYSFVGAKQGNGFPNKRRSRKVKASSVTKKTPAPRPPAVVQPQTKDSTAIAKKDAIKPKVEGGTKYEETEILVLRSIDGVEEGYYLVVNVFSKKYNFNRFMVELAKKGLYPKYFFDSERQYYYVYLKRYTTEDEAEEVRLSNYDGKYEDELWVLGVKNKD